jgi:hypothetical protein
MKVTINHKGEVELDISNGDGQAAMDLIRSLQADARRKHVDMAKVSTGRLNALQFKTWEFLAENDCEVGVHVDAIGRHLGITPGAAGQRCYTLVSLGYASRVSNGRYRALTPANG